MDIEPTAECTACGASLEVNNVGPCPNCGKVGAKRVYKKLEGKITPIGTLELSKIHNSFTFNTFAIIGLIFITLFSPIIGMVFSGLRGILISYGLNIIGIVIGCFAITKVREIERYMRKGITASLSSGIRKQGDS